MFDGRRSRMGDQTKKFLQRAAALVMTASVMFGSAVHVNAEEEVLDYEASYATAPETNSLEGWPQGPQVYGYSAIVMDMNSGAILYEKQADEQRYPASITKLLTALVALENAELDDEVTFSEDSVSFLEYGDACIGMTPGEKLSLNDALYGMLLASANEVSYAIAESVGTEMGGNYDTFIQEMNDRASELGCTGSHWMNANGLHDEQHYTTAHDMAVIASAVYKYEEFRKVVQTLNYTIGPTNLVSESRTFQQNHKMLWPESEYYYELCTGGKTGYTDQSRTTLVTMADNGTLQLAAVVLKDNGGVAYEDTRKLFDYGFNNFSKVPLNEQKKPDGVESYTEKDAYVLLPAGLDFSSLTEEITIDDKEKATGTVTYYYKGQNVGSAKVSLTSEYIGEKTGYTDEPEIGGTVKNGKSEEQSRVLPVRLFVVAVTGTFVILVFFLIIARYQALRRRRQMARRRSRYRRYRESGGRSGQVKFREQEKWRETSDPSRRRERRAEVYSTSGRRRRETADYRSSRGRRKRYD